MTDSLGQSQVIAYLEKIAKKGVDYHLISFEKPEVFEKKKGTIAARIKDSSIIWHPLSYTKKPPVLSTLKDINRGWAKIKELQETGTFDIVHCRGYIAAILGQRMKKRWGTHFIFDMRGWWPDEKLESGFWNSPVYKPVYSYFKKLERQFFKNSDFTVSLTYAGKDEIVKNKWKEADAIGVIPTCVDFGIFKPFEEVTRNAVRAELKIPLDAQVLLYSGSLGGNYKLEDFLEVYRAFKTVSPNGYFLILSKTEPEPVLQFIEESGIDASSIIITSADYDEVYKYIHASDVGLIIYSITYSVIGRSPTKLGEYWAGGIPAISLKGVGDLDTIMEKYPQGGVLVDSLVQDELQSAFRTLLFDRSPDRSILREAAVDYFDVSKGVEFYYTNYCKA
ncbi:glycosyltransferase [Rufibacter immobilis]|nr:glycosyltransferase [Rufibacter immobilis]